MRKKKQIHACMKNFVASLFTAALLFSAMPSFAQIPVTDAGSIQQSILNSTKEVEQMVRQIEELKRQYEAVTGSYGRGISGLDDAINAAKNVPGSWQDIVNKQASGEFGQKMTKYEDIFKPLPKENYSEGSRAGTAYGMASDAVIASFAGAEVLYEELQTHLKNVESLSKQIESTTNIKDAQDLQNRLVAEQGFIQTAMGKMQTLQMNLEGNLLNQRLQAEAEHQEYNTYKGSGRIFNKGTKK